MPSPVLVRETLATGGQLPGVVRSAVAVAHALGEPGHRPSGTEPDDRALIADLSIRTGLAAGEVGAGLRALREAGVVTGGEAGVRVDPDLFCSLPALAALDEEHCRGAIEGTGGRMAPALAVLRTIARASRIGLDGGGEWVQISVQELAVETLYGRTAITQALGELTEAGLVIRAEQAPRHGLRLRLHPRALGTGGSAAAGSAATERPDRSGSGRSAPARGGQGVTVEIGGASVSVPAGSRLQLPSGMDYRLEIGLDGGAIIRIDD
jgi:DNA-binding transcriptional ArsR family regulator